MPLMLTIFLALASTGLPEPLFIKSLLSRVFNLPLSSLHSGYMNFSALVTPFQSSKKCIDLCSSCPAMLCYPKLTPWAETSVLNRGTVLHWMKQLHHILALLAITQPEYSGFTFFPGKEELITKLQRN